MNGYLQGFGLLFNPWMDVYTMWMKAFYDSDLFMRRFIRHPSDIPISYCLGESGDKLERLKDVGRGGLCFNAACPLRKGTAIRIEIPLHHPPYRAEGHVAWCRPEGDHYSIGVQFSDNSTRFSLRMVEQVCHIEHYRVQVLEKEGRELTSEEAAEEWVGKYAAGFPAH